MQINSTFVSDILKNVIAAQQYLIRSPLDFSLRGQSQDISRILMKFFLCWDVQNIGNRRLAFETSTLKR